MEGAGQGTPWPVSETAELQCLHGTVGLLHMASPSQTDTHKQLTLQEAAQLLTSSF